MRYKAVIVVVALAAIALIVWTMYFSGRAKAPEGPDFQGTPVTIN